MALYHLKLKSNIYATAHLEYINREGKYENRLEELIYKGYKNLPDGFESPQDFWEQVILHDRENGNIYRELEISVPVEYSNEKNLQIMKEFMEDTFRDKFFYNYAMHNKDDENGTHNPHFHIMFYKAEIDGIKRENKEQYFKRYNHFNPEKGGWRVNDDFGNGKFLKEVRKNWEIHLNSYLIADGIEPVSCETLKKQREIALQKGDFKKADELDREPINRDTQYKKVATIEKRTITRKELLEQCQKKLDFYDELKKTKRFEKIYEDKPIEIIFDKYIKNINKLSELNSKESYTEKEAKRYNSIAFKHKKLKKLLEKQNVNIDKLLEYNKLLDSKNDVELLNDYMDINNDIKKIDKTLNNEVYLKELVLNNISSKKYFSVKKEIKKLMKFNDELIKELELNPKNPSKQSMLERKIDKNNKIINEFNDLIKIFDNNLPDYKSNNKEKTTKIEKEIQNIRELLISKDKDKFHSGLNSIKKKYLGTKFMLNQKLKYINSNLRTRNLDFKTLYKLYKVNSNRKSLGNLLNQISKGGYNTDFMSNFDKENEINANKADKKKQHNLDKDIDEEDWWS